MRQRLLATIAAISAAGLVVAGCSSSTAATDSARSETSISSSGQQPSQTSTSSESGGPSTDDAAAGTTSMEPEEPALPEPQEVAAEQGPLVIGYFIQWGLYARKFFVKNIEDSGAAANLTHILYAFGNVDRGKCLVGDGWADHDKAFTAEESLDGVDQGEADLSGTRGNFAQLRMLKEKHPGLKVLWSFGGWTWSSGFPEASKDPVKFAESCYDLIHDPRWDGLFDGIDIDWEYPMACGDSCDTESGWDGYANLIKALRAKFGPDELITSAITADGSTGGKLEQANYAEAAKYLNFVMPMTYDYFGAWERKGPVAPHSPLSAYEGIPNPELNGEHTIEKLVQMGIPKEKLLLGLGFYGRGWNGVNDPAPGSESTFGAARGTYEAGFEDYKVLKEKCPPTGTVGGTAYAFCNGQWWGYDTPETIEGKMRYVKDAGLAGAFFWELSGDTADAELTAAIAEGLK